uniref:PKS_ER domain-containing protein n=1 Tax=Panagrellus redivivus TaxID=6233 RepID=A0A7E4VFM6_PANRE
MPILGVAIPKVIAVKVYDTDTDSIKTEPADSGLKIEYEKNREPFECLFEQLKIQFDLLVIVSEIPDESLLNPIIAAAKTVAKEVYIIPPLMARFMAVIDALSKDTLNYSTCFSIVTDALGGDVHVFLQRSGNPKAFKCTFEAFLKPGECVSYQKLTIRPDKIISLSFKDGPPSQVSSVPKIVACKRLELDNFTQMLYNGALAKAKQIAGLWEKVYIEDFVQTMVVRIGQEIHYVAGTGTPIPLEKTMSKNIDAQNVIFEVERAQQIKVIGGNWRRSITRVCPPERLSYVTVDLNISIDSYGVTKVLLKLPDASKPGIVTPVSSHSTVKAVKPNWKLENVLAHVFLSSKFIYHGSDGSPMEVDIEGVEEIATGTDLTPDLVKSHCEAVFDHLPPSFTESFIFILNHDGTYPAALIKAAAEVIETKFAQTNSRGFIISDLIAYTRYALRRLHHTTIDNSSYGFIALNNGTDCRTIFIERSESQGWGVTDTFHESYESTSQLCQFLTNELQQQGTRTKLLLTLSAPLSLQNLMARHGVTIKRVKNFDKALVDGILDFGDSETETEITNKQRDFVSVVYIRQGDSEEYELIKHSQTPFKITVEHQLDAGYRNLTIYQKLAVFTDKEFVLFQCDEVPESVSDLSITFELDPFGIPKISIDPPLPEVNYTAKKAEPRPQNVDPVPSLAYSSSTASIPYPSRPLSSVPSSTRTSIASLATTSSAGATGASRIDKRIKHLGNMNAEIVITCDPTSPTAQIELFDNGVLTLVPDVNDTVNIPLFVSFAQKDVRIGFSAMHDFIEHPKSVVWDFLHILGRTASEITVNPKWQFNIHDLTDEPPNAGIEVEMADRGSVLLPADMIFSCFLKAVQRLVEAKTGKKRNNFFFYVPRSASKCQSGMREACKFLGFFFAGTNLLKS